MKYLILAFLASCAALSVVEAPKEELPIVVEPIVEVPVFRECLKGFSNNEHVRRAPPESFIQDLFKWVKDAPKELYEKNNETRDVYSHLASYLGISSDSTLQYRQAVLFELLRVSAAMESSFNWQEGRDKAASNYDLYTQEAGIFQTSPNSHIYAHKGYGRWEYLDKLVAKHGVGLVKQDSPNNALWNALMKDESKKEVIFEHHAFMLRHNFKHYGPMIDFRRVGMNINKSCIVEVMSML
jgi:hypothetical protein